MDAVLRAREFDDALFHHRVKEADGEGVFRFLGIRLVGVGDAVVGHSEIHIERIVRALALAEHAGLDIALAFARAEENVPPPAAFDHPAGDVVVLVLVAVGGQLGAVFVPLEMRAHLITAVLEVGIVGQLVASPFVIFIIFDRPYALDLHPNRVHNAHGVDVPDDGGLPVDGGKNALERFVGGDLQRGFFAADAHDRVGKQRVSAADFKFDCVAVRHDAPPFRKPFAGGMPVPRPFRRGRAHGGRPRHICFTAHSPFQTCHTFQNSGLFSVKKPVSSS